MKKQAAKARNRKALRAMPPKRAHRSIKVSRPKVAAKAKPSRPNLKTSLPQAKPAPKPIPKALPARAVPAPLPDPRFAEQQRHYDEAMRLFQAHKFERAGALFQKAIEGPNRSLAHHAQMHFQICQKRLQPPEVKLQTAEDHYNYAITLMNIRRLPEAARHLEAALQLAPRGGHVHYALAATQALLGNAQGAYERLKTAIELDPRNRGLARADADFTGILQYPPVASLLHIERDAPKAL